MFQNEPLGLAKNLVNASDPLRESDASRSYLFVAPNLRDSVMDQGTFRSDKATFAATAMRLVTAVFNQARFRDWVKVEQLNEQVRRFDQQAEVLAGQMGPGSALIGKLGPTARALMPVLYGGDAARVDAARKRLARQFDREYRALAAADAAAADEWMDAVVALEKIAGVEERDDMRVSVPPVPRRDRLDRLDRRLANLDARDEPGRCLGTPEPKKVAVGVALVVASLVVVARVQLRELNRRPRGAKTPAPPY